MVNSMSKFIPNMYKKDIFSIDYNYLKNKGIKVLLFDLDNTLIEKGNYKINEKAIELFNDLKKDFTIYIVSNSINTKKIKKVSEALGIEYIKDSRKPFKHGFKKLNLENVKENEIAMIGDQMVTDVWGGNRMNYFTILVDPINFDEWFGTKINRLIEKRIFTKNGRKRGGYYD